MTTLKFAIAILALAFVGSTIQAQTGWNWNTQEYYNSGNSVTPSAGDYYDSGSQVPVYTVDPSICYEPGWDFSAFFSAMFPNSSDGETGLGGGFALSYFFDRNIGIETNYAAHGQGESLHVFHTNAVYRLPVNGCFCGAFAPYAFGGVGFQANGEFDLLFDIGAGFEVRFESWGCTALFADYSYNFVEKNNDFQQVRTGFRLPF